MEKAAEAAEGIPVLFLLSGCKRRAIKVVGEAVQEALTIGKREIANLQR
jgi:hypothetical protein